MERLCPGFVFLVPLECYTDICFACPVDCDAVPSFECVLEMLDVALASEFDADVVDY